MSDKDTIKNYSFNSQKYIVNLQKGLDVKLSQAYEYIVNRIDTDKIVHLTLQPNYIRLNDDEINEPLKRFLRYKFGSEVVDNDVSYVAMCLYLLMHDFLDVETLRNQLWVDNNTFLINVYQKKLVVNSFRDRVLGNIRVSSEEYYGDVCTSFWVLLKNHINHNIVVGLESGNQDTLDFVDKLGSKEIKSLGSVEKLISDKRNNPGEFIELIRKHISSNCLLALDLSDSIGNFMLSPKSCNPARAGLYGDCDTIEYFLVHVYKYFETGDVRFLNRLYAGYWRNGMFWYKKFNKLEDVDKEANLYSLSFLSMLERAGVKSWEEFCDEFCFNSFCMDWDEYKRPVDLRTGRVFEWDGEKHYDVSNSYWNVETDNKMFSNLVERIGMRCEEIGVKIREKL